MFLTRCVSHSFCLSHSLSPTLSLSHYHSHSFFPSCLSLFLAHSFSFSLVVSVSQTLVDSLSLSYSFSLFTCCLFDSLCLSFTPSLDGSLSLVGTVCVSLTRVASHFVCIALIASLARCLSPPLSLFVSLVLPPSPHCFSLIHSLPTRHLNLSHSTLSQNISLIVYLFSLLAVSSLHSFSHSLTQVSCSPPYVMATRQWNNPAALLPSERDGTTMSNTTTTEAALKTGLSIVLDRTAL